MKACTKCGEAKPLTEFGPKKWVRDGEVALGYRSVCYECRRIPPELKRVPYTEEERIAKIKERKRAYREKHKDKIAEKKARDAKTEHGRELDRARGKRYRLAHPERVKEAHAKAQLKRKDIDKENAREKRIELRDSYVAQMLKLPTAEVPPELIEAERVRLKVKRVVAELSKDSMSRKCSTCKEHRPLLSFSKNGSGYGYECLFCNRERKKKSREAKGLTYKSRPFDEFGRLQRMDPEQVRANKNARERERYALNKQRKQHEKHN